MFSVWDAFWLLWAAFFWVAPWHVSALRDIRLTWNDRTCMGITIWLLVFDSVYLVVRVFQRDYSQAIVDTGYAIMASYSLWRAWREHKPPRRKLRDRVSELGEKLSQRMTPVRIPVLAGT